MEVHRHSEGTCSGGHLVRLASSLGQLRSRQGVRSRQRQGTRLALTHYFTATHFCQRMGTGAGRKAMATRRPGFLTPAHGASSATFTGQTPPHLVAREEEKLTLSARGCAVHPTLRSQLCPCAHCGCELGLCPTLSSGSQGSHTSWPSGCVRATRSGQPGLAPASVPLLTAPRAWYRITQGGPRTGARAGD